MATDLIPFSFDAREVRLIDRSGEIWFVATDVAEVLGYRNAPDMTRNLDDDETATHNLRIRSENGVEQDRELTIINESGLYAAILKSRKSEAKRFRKWVTSEVLPAIRKTGQYVAPRARPEKTRKALPGGLTVEQQDAIKALVKSRVEVLPHDAQAKAAITCWSSIKSKFGVSYKEVPAEQFTEVLSLVARLELDKAVPKALPLDLNYPLESARPPEGCNGLSFHAFAQAEGWIDPNWELLMKLKAAGFNVDGPIYSHQAKIHVMTALYHGLIGKMVDSMNVACTSLAYAPIYLR